MEDELEVLVEETGRITDRKLSGKEVRPGCLGRLGGPIADWGAGTRNGRLYTKDLWEKVFSTPWVQEAIETKTLFGEADHPDERLESKLSLAAVVMVDYKFIDEQQMLYGWFDILDTPSGRILRTLADYGCRLGVSSRGRGEIIERNGQQVVKESSYLFGGFDIVALPAVKKARQNFVPESYSIENDSLYDSIKSQIDDCRTASELDIIKGVLESAKLDNLGEYLMLIETKSNELNSSDNTIVEKLTNELQKSYSELNKVRSRRIHRSRSRIDTINEDTERMEKENTKLFSELYHENSKLKSMLVLKDDLIKSSQSKLEGKIKDLSAHLESLESENQSLAKKTRLIERLKSTNNALDEENQSLKAKVRELSLRSKSDLKDYNDLVNQYNELSEELDVLEKEYSEVLDKYLEVRCSQVSGLDTDLAHRFLPENYTIDDIDSVVESQDNLRRRMSKLPIYSSSLDKPSYIVESSKPVTSGEYSNLSRMLTNMKNG